MVYLSHFHQNSEVCLPNPVQLICIFTAPHYTALVTASVLRRPQQEKLIFLFLLESHVLLKVKLFINLTAIVKIYVNTSEIYQWTNILCQFNTFQHLLQVFSVILFCDFRAYCISALCS